MLLDNYRDIGLANVVGMSEQEAKGTLEKLGLVVQSTYLEEKT